MQQVWEAIIIAAVVEVYSARKVVIITAAVLSSIDCDADRMTVLVHDVVVSNAEVVR